MAKLFYRYAAMSAGKSTQLLQIAHNYESNGRDVLLLTSSVDNRAGHGRIASRLGVSRMAAMVHPETDLFDVVKEYRASVTDDELGAILVDEAQFLTANQVRDLHRGVHTFNVPALCFGLRSDFQGMPFEGSTMLLTLAEVIEEVRNVCGCGAKKATMNIRVDETGARVQEGPQVLIGDATYRPVCGRCFYS